MPSPIMGPKGWEGKVLFRKVLSDHSEITAGNRRTRRIYNAKLYNFNMFIFIGY